MAQPTVTLLGGFGHFRLLLVRNTAGRILRYPFGNGLKDMRLGDTAKVAVHGRRPVLRHVQRQRGRQPVRRLQRPGLAIPR